MKKPKTYADEIDVMALAGALEATIIIHHPGNPGQLAYRVQDSTPNTYHVSLRGAHYCPLEPIAPA